MAKEDIDSILAGKYPAKAHAAKVASHLKTALGELDSGTIYLQGQKSVLHEDNDQDVIFR